MGSLGPSYDSNTKYVDIRYIVVSTSMQIYDLALISFGYEDKKGVLA